MNEFNYYYPTYTGRGRHGLWYHLDGRRNYDKHERPYSYSPFFVHGDHDSIAGSHVDYTDRYQLWDKDKIDYALAAVGRRCQWDQMTRQEYQRFVTAYYGKDYTFTGAVEWCNASNGYPCWSIHFKENN